MELALPMFVMTRLRSRRSKLPLALCDTNPRGCHEHGLNDRGQRLLSHVGSIWGGRAENVRYDLWCKQTKAFPCHKLQSNPAAGCSHKPRLAVLFALPALTPAEIFMTK